MNYKLYADIQNGEYGFWTAPTKNKPSSFVSLGPAVMIKKITENIETEDVKLKLAIEYMGRNKSIIIPRDELSDNRLIQSLNKIGAKCPKHHFDILVESIMRQETELEEEGYKPYCLLQRMAFNGCP